MMINLALPTTAADWPLPPIATYLPRLLSTTKGNTRRSSSRCTAGGLPQEELRQLLAQSAMLFAVAQIIVVVVLVAFVDADAAGSSALSGTVSGALVVAHALLLFLGRLGTTAVAFWR